MYWRFCSSTVHNITGQIETHLLIFRAVDTMKRYSAFSLLKNALSYHENWQKVWRNPTPKKDYDVIIVGGGGHGLATAYYLAKVHGITNVAVVEKGYLGGGNTARNTTIIRSNYLWDEAAQLYELSLKLWEGLSQELNYNVMFSQRGVLNLGHNLQDMRDIERRVNANRLNGIDGEVVTPERIKEIAPLIIFPATAAILFWVLHGNLVAAQRAMMQLRGAMLVEQMHWV